MFLLGPGEQGILYEHRELEFGDHHDPVLLAEALQQIPLLAAAEDTQE